MKRHGFFKTTLLILFVGVIALPGPEIGTAGNTAPAPRNVILLIGDGMGPEHVRAGGMYLNGQPGTLSFETMPWQTTVTTHATGGAVTDSAAAATAMACGIKVSNGVISRRLPGDGSDLKTVLEQFQERGRRVGLVTTTYLPHATPAAFGAHADNRNQFNSIASEYLTSTRPNILFGGGNYMNAGVAQANGYTVVTDRAGLLALDTDTLEHVAGFFGGSHLPYEYDGLNNLPHLSEMAQVALSLLEKDTDGFFAMIEGGRIDHAGHDNDIERNVRETAEFSRTVQVVLDWATGREDTLILVTADHETGGMEILSNRGAGQAPEVTWSTGWHTGVPVGLYGWGVNAEMVEDAEDNTDIYHILKTGVPPPALVGHAGLTVY